MSARTKHCHGALPVLAADFLPARVADSLLDPVADSQRARVVAVEGGSALAEWLFRFHL